MKIIDWENNTVFLNISRYLSCKQLTNNTTAKKCDNVNIEMDLKMQIITFCTYADM